MAAESYIRYYADGSTTRFNIPFPYLLKTHIKVKVKGTYTEDFTFFDDATIELGFTPAQDDIVVIYRDTNSDNRLVVYENGSILDADDLNKDSQQLFYLIQESLDRYLDSAMTDSITESMVQDWIDDEVSVSMTTDLILDRLQGQITESELYQDLNTKIGKGEQAYSQTELLKDQWTVKLQNDGHIVGMGLNLHDEWQSDVTYQVGDYVWNPSDENVYKCIYAHEGVEPPDEGYWELIEFGARSNFIVQTDKFAIVNPDDSGDTKVPFVVGTVGGVTTVGVDGNLIVDGTVAANHLASDSISVGHIGDTSDIINYYGRSKDTQIEKLEKEDTTQSDWAEGTLDDAYATPDHNLELTFGGKVYTANDEALMTSGGESFYAKDRTT